MSEHRVTVRWDRTSPDFSYDTYNREHTWTFPGGQSLDASSAPEYQGDATCANPEEALAAAVSSCHMLTFLAIAARKRYTVEYYTDNAVAVLEKNADGAVVVTRVELNPSVSFSGPTTPSPEEITALHEKAHQHCFIANSIKCEVVVNE